jgi:GT2 family glycosyltransferase
MGAAVLPVEKDVRPERFLPSSRSVAFPKSAWEEVGGYPEWLDYCEDLVFDLRLQARGYDFVFVPLAVARFRPRGSLSTFFKQYFRYGRGDGKANLWAQRHAVRYCTYLVAGPMLAWLAIHQHALWVTPLVVGAVAMFWTPYRRLLPAVQGLKPPDLLKALLWVPVIRATGDVAKMLGYPVGVCWRLRRRAQIPDWRN